MALNCGASRACSVGMASADGAGRTPGAFRVSEGPLLLVKARDL
jgi:hypothetical protein